MKNLLEVARTTEIFALNTRSALKLRRFSSPDLASLKCYAFLLLGGKGTDNISDYDLALFPPQFEN